MAKVRISVELEQATYEQLNADGKAGVLIGQGIEQALAIAATRPPQSGEAADIAASSQKLFGGAA